MAVGGIAGAQQSLALSGLRGVNAQTRAFGEGVSQTLETAEQVGSSRLATESAPQSSGASGATSLETPSDTSRVQASSGSDGSRGANLDILA